MLLVTRKEAHQRIHIKRKYKIGKEVKGIKSVKKRSNKNNKQRIFRILFSWS